MKSSSIDGVHIEGNIDQGEETKWNPQEHLGWKETNAYGDVIFDVAGKKSKAKVWCKCFIVIKTSIFFITWIIKFWHKVSCKKEKYFQEIIHFRTEATTGGFLWKKMFQKISQNWQGKSCLQLCWKRDSDTDVYFLSLSKFFKTSFLENT